VCGISYAVCYLMPCPLRRGSSPSFYRPRRGRITCMPHYSATWGSMVRRAVEWAAALTVLAVICPSWRILYPNSGSFEGRSAVVGRDVPMWARGGCRRRPVRDTVAGVVASRSRTPHSAGAVTAVPGVGLYARGWPPAVNSGRDGAPPA
jgi:hypothetical protein